ncbi:unnamed protein product [Cuscuta epithymum]|uniref:Transposase MuDR plant domain-containing protein n=1 Tax=Cuscuta epithymum TaxID=186058 RepID=A0AAV0DLZ8_9ASTE|nr:unnamed protein product [Cuscuta epithymum]
MSGSGMQRFAPEGEIEVGQQFNNKEQIINMVSLYSIKRNQFYRVMESDKYKWVAQCKRKKECDCPWRICATKNKDNLDSFTIVRYPGPHSATCVTKNISSSFTSISFSHVKEHVNRVAHDLIRVAGFMFDRYIWYYRYPSCISSYLDHDFINNFNYFFFKSIQIFCQFDYTLYYYTLSFSV